jgi:hypothetical protein
MILYRTEGKYLHQEGIPWICISQILIKHVCLCVCVEMIGNKKKENYKCNQREPLVQIFLNNFSFSFWKPRAELNPPPKKK